MVDQKPVPVAPKSPGAKSRQLNDVYLKPGAKFLARVGHRGGFLGLGGSSEMLTGALPATLPRGTWTLEKGQTRVVFQTRCVE